MPLLPESAIRSEGFTRPLPTALTVAAMVASMGLLGLALRDLPVGTAYAVWVGVGALGIGLGLCLRLCLGLGLGLDQQRRGPCRRQGDYRLCRARRSA